MKLFVVVLTFAACSNALEIGGKFSGLAGKFGNTNGIKDKVEGAVDNVKNAVNLESLPGLDIESLADELSAVNSGISLDALVEQAKNLNQANELNDIIQQAVLETKAKLEANELKTVIEQIESEIQKLVKDTIEQAQSNVEGIELEKLTEQIQHMEQLEKLLKDIELVDLINPVNAVERKIAMAKAGLEMTKKINEEGKEQFKQAMERHNNAVENKKAAIEKMNNRAKELMGKHGEAFTDLANDFSFEKAGELFNKANTAHMAALKNKFEEGKGKHDAAIEQAILESGKFKDFVSEGQANHEKSVAGLKAKASERWNAHEAGVEKAKNSVDGLLSGVNSVSGLWGKARDGLGLGAENDQLGAAAKKATSFFGGLGKLGLGGKGKAGAEGDAAAKAELEGGLGAGMGFGTISFG